MVGILIILALTVVIITCTVIVVRQGADRAPSARAYLQHSPTWLGARIIEDPTPAPSTLPVVEEIEEDILDDADEFAEEPRIAAAPHDSIGASSDLAAPAFPAPTIEPPQGARLRDTSAESKSLQREQLLDNVIQGLDRAPPLPHVLLKILTELDSMGSSARSLGAIVSGEPVLTAILLRAANSSASGLRRDIISVDEAVAYLGYSTVRALVLRMQLAKLLPQKHGAGYDSEELWHHSLVVSQLASHLAGRISGVDAGLASTIGLLHDIGKLAINSLFPDVVARLWKRDDPGVPADESFLARERRLFGADHAFIGGFLAAQWKLPQELAEAIRLHHLPGGDASLASMSPQLSRATKIVHVANQLAKYSHVYCADMEIDILHEEFLSELGLPPQLEDLLARPDVKDAIRRAQLLCGAGTKSPKRATTTTGTVAATTTSGNSSSTPATPSVTGKPTKRKPRKKPSK
jgi:putative nucleotidyltransferase with HDIG domain